MKGVPFLSKMVYKRVRVWTSGRSLPYVYNFLMSVQNEMAPVFGIFFASFDMNVLENA